MASALREAYADLFQLNRNAQTLSKNEVQAKMKTLSQGAHNDDVLHKMASTFKGFCSLANFDAIDNDVVDEADDENPVTKQEARPPVQNGMNLNGLHYNINIHLPESRDPAVYDALFRSLRDHLT